MRALLLLLPWLCGCVSLNYEAASEQEPVAEDRHAGIRPGTSRMQECLTGLGAPNLVWPLTGGRYALVWAWYADSGWRLRFSYSVQRFANLSIAYSEEGLHFNGLVLVFDRDDRLVEKRTGHLDRLEAEIRRPSQLTPVDDTGT
ncbi:MAG: hypothetical protein IT458_10000 [Planctomycetes bacterium]|nr:hypothetical protein [Planctomycetota bacterium]